MNPAATWPEHVGVALLGTSRAPALPALGAPWSALEDPSAPTPRRLASRLAGLSTGLRAGRDAAERTSNLPPPPPEDRPVARSAARRVLDRLLDEGDGDILVREWLELALRHGVRPPPGRLPDLVLKARNHPGIFRLLPSAAGSLLPWYAGLDPRAAPLVAPAGTALETWNSPETVHRLAALHLLRREDPANARALLQACWKAENAETRATLLDGLRSELGPEDEPFLESCLDDRSRAVRSAAADILARLATSAVAIRLRARLAELVRLEVRNGILGLGRKVAATVELPPAGDGPLERDLGIGPNPGQKPSPSTGGERSRILALLVGRTASASWTESGASPAEILEAFGRTDFAQPLVDGLREAALAGRDQVWARLLLSLPRLSSDTELLSILPTAERRSHLLARLEAGDEIAAARLLDDDDPWDEAHTRLVSGRMWELRSSYKDSWRWRALLPLANHGHVGALHQELPRWSGSDTSLDPGLSRLLAARIELRIELHQAFAKDAPP